MSKDLLLAIDVGTQSTRALVFDLKGEIVDSSKVIYDKPYIATKSGWAEQDPLYYWKRIVDACQNLWKQAKVKPESIASIALTTQRCTLVNLDKDGNPLRKAIVWLDQRRAKKLPSLGFPWTQIFNLVGLKNTIQYLQAEAEVNWIKENELEVWDKTAHYLYLSGYLLYKLTGKYVDSVSSQVGYVPFDYKRLAWAKSNSWKWKAIPVEKEKLPKLIPPGDEIGRLSADAASPLGLPKDLLIISAGSDKAMEVLGSGGVNPNQGCIGYGTTSTINVNYDKYVEPVTLLPAYPSGIKDSYNLEVQTYRGFWMVTWFIEQFTDKERKIAEELDISTEEVLEGLVPKVPPGSDGLMLQPYWSPGLKFPGPEAKGCIIGFGGIHKKEHMYRAILEGLAYSIREGKELIEKRTKIKMDEIFISGGGSKSDQMMQITADILNLPVKRPYSHETSGLGAAILAATGAKLYPDVETAVKEMTKAKDIFYPNPEAVKIYDDLYKNVYLKLYNKLKPLYKSIQKITNYPDTI